MVLKPLSDSIHLLKHPVLWIPGIYAGIITAITIWLEFSGGVFIAGKVIFLGAIIAPFFIGGALGCMSQTGYHLTGFCRNAVRYYFPVLLVYILAITISILLLILFSIPFAIAGLGSDPTMIGGLFIGIIVPVILFSFFAENVAVSEGLKVFASLKQSMILASRSFSAIIICIIVTALHAGVLTIIIATVWGMILSEKFSQYLDLTMTEQQQVFSGYGLAEWQQTLGPDGIIVTAIMVGIFIAMLTAFFVVYKHQCYQAAASVPAPVIRQQTGEFDEKGRWYKY